MMHQFDVNAGLAGGPRLRPGPPPRTSGVLPFRQLDQLPPAEIHRQLIAECAALPGVRLRESRMASSETVAMWLPTGLAGGPAESFIDLPEFCHLHPMPEGTIHLTLPPAVLERALALGWAERHPLATTGILKTLTMIYAPRNSAELEIAMGLIGCSYRFARGESTATAAHVA